jgi:hypothetical protein
VTRLELTGRWHGEPLHLTYGAGGWSGWPSPVLDDLDRATGQPLDMTVTGPFVHLDLVDLTAAAIYMVRGLDVELDVASLAAMDALLEADDRLRIPPGALA